MAIKMMYVVHSRTLTQYERSTGAMDPDLSAELDRRGKEDLEALTQVLASGGKILDVFDTEHDSWKMRAYLIDEGNSMVVDGVRVVILQGAEVVETYSKSHGKEFNYIRAYFGSGEIVNIFDHPDTGRNTFKFAKRLGWTFTDLVTAIDTSDCGVPAMITKQDNWNSLVGIMSHDDFKALVTSANDTSAIEKLQAPSFEEEEDE